jgi:GNAT superfamily N-acetyltransferase
MAALAQNDVFTRNLITVKDSALNFLQEILGADGTAALRQAAEREPALEPLLVPRAALAWIASHRGYEGLLPGNPNSYLRFRKHEDGLTGAMSCGDFSYDFRGVSAEHLAAATSAAVGVDLQNRREIRDAVLVRLGKSIDALVGAQHLAKRVLDPKEGYAFRDEEGPEGLRVHSFLGNKKVGTAWFKPHSETHLKPVSVVVDEDHQRKGLATALYDHARRVSGKEILPGNLQTPEGQAFRAAYKTELPGQTAKPKAQLEPIGPQQPQKQSRAARPRVPGITVGKTEAQRPCGACGGQQFSGQEFRGCLCFRELRKATTVTTYGDGYVLEFQGSVDRALVAELRKVFRDE